MKRYFLFATMLLLAAAACQEKENLGGETPEPGTTYTLEGTVAADGFTWKSGAALSLFSATDGVRIQNGKCAIASDGAGQATAKFTTPGIDLVAGENKLAVAYPYNASALYTSGRFTNFNLGDQTVAAPGVAADYIAAGYATGTPGVDETFKFELTPVTAIAEVKIGTAMADYAGAKINKVSLSNSELSLGGGFNIDASSAVTLQPIDGKGTTSVAVNISAPEALSSTAQTVYVSLLPADFTGKDLNILLSGTDAAGEPLTITLKTSDVKFEAGKTTTLDFSDIKAEDVVVEAWYCNTDTRLLPGLGYAYGQANTFIIQCKNGSTYTGGTYAANADIPDEVVIDYRIRGNRANITDDMIPDDVTFEWMKKKNGSIYTARPGSLDDAGIVIDEDSFTFTPDPENYTVTVKNNDAYAGSPILLMKNKNGEILWAWAFWNIAADGTTLDKVSAGSYEFASMDLGQATTNAEAFIKGELYIYSTNLLYQWGRPFPVLWEQMWKPDGYNGQNQNVPYVEGPLSLSESLHAVGMIYSTAAMQNWCTEVHPDLWGAAAEEGDEEGKSIYDPCPKGWRVATPEAYAALTNPVFTTENNANIATFGDLKIWGNGNAKGTAMESHLGDDGRTENMQFQSAAANRTWIWSNTGGELQASNLFIDFRTTGTEEPQVVRVGTSDISTIMSVRCIVDTENR